MKFLLALTLLISGVAKATPSEQNIEGAAFLMLFCPACMIPGALEEEEEKQETEEKVEESEIKSPQ